MANPRNVQNADWEGNLAAVSLAGVRPLVHASVSVGGSSEVTYTITHPSAKRVILIHDAAGNDDIRMALNETASASTLPVLPAMYFVVEVDPAEAIHLFNTTGGAITVYIAEIR